MEYEDYDEYDEQQIGPDEYAYFCYQQGHVDQLDHADPANYAASYIVQAPAPTLDTIRTELLPLAHICGYDDVCIGCSANRYGSAYSAHAHGTHGSATLANIFDHPTPKAMRDEDSFGHIDELSRFVGVTSGLNPNTRI